MSDFRKTPFPFRIDFPPELPISSRAEEIVVAIQKHPVVILAGETGSGKTTQIPKMCLAAGRGLNGQIACTQPRRVAALSISRRVAEELGATWGKEVGCKIRFNDQTSSQTVIKFLTDGMLLAEVQGDPLMRRYDTVIIDEAHERSLNIDFLLGHLRQLRFRRPDLKIIITSATIDTEAFSKAFDEAPIIQVSGRTYPVEVIYAPLDSFGSDAAEDDEPTARAEALHYIDGAVESVERILRESTSGDLLIFMPAERDIREMRDLLEGRRFAHCEVVPLFGRLSTADQQRVFSPNSRRKIVVATNIAETSLTIPGIRYVIDTGLARLSRYSPQARTRRLPIEPIAQSSADQRKGRCGRVAEGVCIRLYSEKDYLDRPRFTQPEIQRANLADVILRMKAFGLGDIESFPFINMPASKAIRAGYGLLQELGAIAGGGVAPPPAGEKQEAAGEKGEPRRDGPDVRLGSDSPPPSPEPFARELTALGRELARLPVDPTVGRMILQARLEKCVSEILVIAAGLSIQDPRERPMDARDKADAAHRRFTHPDSDFLTLLNIWDDYHGEFEGMTQSKLRRFCRDHFLSFTRMREWRDVHAQLLDVLKERSDFKFTSVFDGLGAGVSPDNPNAKIAWGTPAYRALHRSILSGLLGNIAVRDDEAGVYKATHDRRVALFPGSVLFAKDDSKKRGNDARHGPKKESKSPRWIMAAEIMETSRLYARTGARLDPTWALDLGAHLLKVAHSEPFWNLEAGRVLVKQRTRLYGLELESRAVSYGRIDPLHATEIFIREGLVGDTITWPLDFIAENRKVRAQLENLLTRARDSHYLNLDEAAYRFYSLHLVDQPRRQGNFRPVSAVAELVALVRERQLTSPDFLQMKPEDLRMTEAPPIDEEAFPEALPLDNRALPLAYTYKPGQADDGVTLDVNVREAEALTPAALNWAVPGHVEPKVEHYLRALPKELRRVFMPFAETATSVAGQLIQRDRLTSRRESFEEALATLLGERSRIRIDSAHWAGKPLPDHLRVRVRVLDDNGDEICASRDLAEVQSALAGRKRELSMNVATEDPDGWRRARARWEKPEETSWTFGNIPERVPVSEQAGVPVSAFPGLVRETNGVAFRLFKTAEEGIASTRRGIERLFELQLRYELAWLQKDLRALRELGTLTSLLGPLEELQDDAYHSLRHWLCAREVSPLTEKAFTTALAQAKADVRGLVPRLLELLRPILELRQTLLVHSHPYTGMDKDLDSLLSPHFLHSTPFPQLAHFPRYLKGRLLRAERWRQNPSKDAERTRQLEPYLAAIATARLPGSPGKNAAAKPMRPEETARLGEARAAFHWLVEEFRVSLFAQELGTSEPVSAQKLDRALAALREPSRNEKANTEGKMSDSPTPENGAKIPVPTLATPLNKKVAPVKSLGSLDSLFRR